MSNQKYYFETLCEKNKKVWMEIAEQCDYAPVNVLDEKNIDFQLDKNIAYGNIIIFDAFTKHPIAIFPAEYTEQKVKCIRFRILRSWFGGLIIPGFNISKALEIRDFFITCVLKSYYLKKIKIDYIELAIPLKKAIEESHKIFEIIPFLVSKITVNTILYSKLEENLLDKFKYNVKRETLIGLNNLKTTKVLLKGDKNIFKYIKKVEHQKASFLKIKPLDDDYLKRIIESRFFYPLIALNGDEPLAAVIYSYSNEIGTFNYNSSTKEGKKLFINKALLFKAMEGSRRIGARYFVLGHGEEFSSVGSINKQLKGVTFFKKSFSTDEVDFFRFTCPLTYRGSFLTAIKQLRSL